MDLFHRTLTHTATDSSPYADSIVPTDDGFRYSIETGKGQNGGQLSPNHSNSIDEDNDNENHSSSLSTWAVVSIFMAICVLVFVWCFYAIRSACKHEASRRTAATGTEQGAATSNDLPQKVRKARLFAYFERVGFQIIVQDEDLLHAPTSGTKGDEVDVEEAACRLEGEDDCEKDNDASEDHIEMSLSLEENWDGECTEQLVLVLKKPKSKKEFADGSIHDIEEGGPICGTSCDMEKACATAQGNPSTKDLDVPMSCNVESSSLNSRGNADTAATTEEQYVSDPCAICLEPYQAGDTVVWSATETCPHVFHKDCLVNYLLRYRGEGTPCPSCRQSFCDNSIFCLSCNDDKQHATSVQEEPSNTVANSTSTNDNVHNITA